MTATGCDNACDPSGCLKADDSMMLLKKLEGMISDNYTMLFILFIILSVLLLALYYFGSSLIKTISIWWRNVQEKRGNGGKSSADNPRAKEDDNDIYYDNPKEDPNYADPFKYAPSGQREYVDNMDKAYKEYNDKKTSYITNTYQKQNDDIIDQKVIYKEYDNYSY